MPGSRLERIRERVQFQQYDMTAHAMEEMAEDELSIGDVVSAVINGNIVRTEKDDPRGEKYIIHGLAVDGATEVGVVGRFVTHDRYLIITVFEVTEA